MVTPTSPKRSSLPRTARVLLWLVAAVGAWVVLEVGVLMTFFISNTSEALETARRGHLVVLGASLALLALAFLVPRPTRFPRAAPLCIGVPAALTALLALATDPSDSVLLLAGLLVPLPLLVGAILALLPSSAPTQGALPD